MGAYGGIALVLGLLSHKVEKVPMMLFCSSESVETFSGEVGGGEGDEHGHH